MNTLKVTEHMNHLLKAGKKYRTYHGAQIGIQLRIMREQIEQMSAMYKNDWNCAYINRILAEMERAANNIEALILDAELAK